MQLKPSRAVGFRTVEALPMRLRDQVIGALNLFRAGPWPLDPADVRLGQALADVATIGLLQERSVRRSETVAEQLQGALNSRVIIEQAKGKLAERLSIDMDQTFTLLSEAVEDRSPGWLPAWLPCSRGCPAARPPGPTPVTVRKPESGRVRDGRRS